MPVKKFTARRDWEDLRFFAMLAERGSLSAAARALGVTHATVSRRVARLEERLGGPLFDRAGTGFRLSARGELIHGEVLSMSKTALAIDDLAHKAKADAPAVKISIPRTMADRFLVPRLAQVCGSLGVELIVSTESRIVSIARSESDLSVRLGRPNDSDTIGRHVATVRYRLYGRADLLDLTSAPMIGPEESDSSAESGWLGQAGHSPRFILRSNSQSAQLAAAEAGAGIALLPTYIVGPSSRLSIIEQAGAPPDREVWLLARKNKLRVAHVRAVFDALLRIFREYWPR